MTTVMCTVIINKAKYTQFMQAADVFERWKVIASLNTFKLTYEDGVELTTERLATSRDAIVGAILAAGDKPVLVWFPGYDTEPFIDMTVKVISDGEHWTTLHKLLTQGGIPHRVDDEMFCHPI